MEKPSAAYVRCDPILCRANESTQWRLTSGAFAASCKKNAAFTEVARLTIMSFYNLVRTADGIPHMKKTSFTIIVFFLFLLAGSVSFAQDAPSPIGTWTTERGGAHVQIKDCGGKLCGTIIWLKNPHDKNGHDSVDSNNPDESLRTRKILGLPLLNGFAQDGSSNVWSDGTIYDPDNGKTYSCKLTMQNDGTMRVRGYVGLSLLGETQIWTRAN
jgi:uncharacterized protein (DUF2147 family)